MSDIKFTVVDDTALRFTVPSNAKGAVTNYIEKSELLNDNGKESELLVYWGLKEALVLGSSTVLVCDTVKHCFPPPRCTRLLITDDVKIMRINIIRIKIIKEKQRKIIFQ